MKRKFVRTTLSLFLILAILLSIPCNAATYAPTVSAKSAVLIDSNRNVIYQKNSDERLGMASTTKIMTALIVAEQMRADSLVCIPDEAVNTEGSSVYLVRGELLSVKELLYALLLASANDAAVALAIAHSGSIADFAAKMNEKAEALGLRDTHFTNPHGLYDDNHYTTAFDLAVLSAAALENDLVREISSTQKATISHGVTKDAPNGDGTKRYLQNHNKLLKLYEGTIGLKTGFTKKTGRCLVSAAERDGLRLIAVTLNAPDDWNDHRAMLDYGYSLYERVTLFNIGEFQYSFAVTGGMSQEVILTNTEEISLILPKKRDKTEYTVTATHRIEFAPVPKGKQLAVLNVRADGKSISIPLRASHEVKRLGKDKTN